MNARPLADLLPAVGHLLGVPRLPDRGRWLSEVLPPVDHVILLLVDGLGYRQLERHAELAPALSTMREFGPLTAPFPATTAVSLTSLGTGLMPGMHGIVATSFRLEEGISLAPLQWTDSPNPIAIQPEPTIFERAVSAGIQVVSAASPEHRASGLTRAALRGGEYQGARSAAEQVRIVARSIAAARSAGRRSLTYVYWAALDRAGHAHGVSSGAYRAALREADQLAERLTGECGPDTILVTTADHGLIDVPDERRFDLESRPALRVGVQTILGEPRARYVYVAPGRVDQVLTTWRSELGHVADVFDRDEASQLLGGVEDWYLDRVGDVVAVAREDWSLVSDRVDRLVSALRGQHGGRTAEEVLVPFKLAGANYS